LRRAGARVPRAGGVFDRKRDPAALFVLRDEDAAVAFVERQVDPGEPQVVERPEGHLDLGPRRDQVQRPVADQIPVAEEPRMAGQDRLAGRVLPHRDKEGGAVAPWDGAVFKLHVEERPSKGRVTSPDGPTLTGAA
jgi:hypothetical protein